MTELNSPETFRLLIIDGDAATHDEIKRFLLAPGTGQAAEFQIDSAFENRQGWEMHLAARRQGIPYSLAFVSVDASSGGDGMETILHLREEDPILQTVLCLEPAQRTWDDIFPRLGITHNVFFLKKPLDRTEVLQLAHALTYKWQCMLQVRMRMQMLDREVEDRTARLRQTVAELVVARDRAEEAARQLKESQTLLSAAEQLSQSGAWRWEKDSGHVEFSTGARRILGASQSSLSVIELMKCLHPDDTVAMEATFAEAQQTNKTALATERRIVTRDTGEERIVTANGKVVRDREGCIVAAHGALQDVTEARRVEAQFRQSQRMDAVGRLASGVAHDFNNLLSVMMGQAELLRDESLPGSQPYKRATEILGTVERATKMTRQLLDIGRPQTLQRVPVDLHGILLGNEEMLRGLLGEQVALSRAYRATRHVINASADQLNQVILNLAVNARDAMLRGGSLMLSTADADPGDPVAARLGHPCVVLTVTDEGVGMDEQVLAKIFDPFFTTKSRGKGTGLGLSTVYSIITNHGGAIEAKSKRGFGSSFMIYLPTIDSLAQAPPPEPARTDTETGSGTILLAEDEEGLRSLLRKFLESGGYKVIEATDSGAAVNCVRETRAGIDMLLTDVVMPGMSGRELAQELKTFHPGLKTLFISGYADNMLAQFDFISEQTCFLQKPFSRGTLLAKVKEVLQS
ncbi:MAG: response regulator [Acidobacteriota bacterium]|nr:response regulator [Acidobacteriota bacterium]